MGSGCDVLRKRLVLAAIIVVAIIIVAAIWVGLGGGEDGLDAVDGYLKMDGGQESFLEDHRFVVVDGSALGQDSFAAVYEELNDEDVPIIVTTDCMLHQYHVFFDSSLRLIEERELLPLALNMSRGAMERALALHANVTDPWLADLALRVVAFYAVPLGLMDPAAQVPAAVASLVDEEMALIASHSGRATSPVFAGLNATTLPHEEDYSQYVARGHYTRSEALKRYFKGMMWYGRQAFYNSSLEESAMAVLATLALLDGSAAGVSAWQAWERIYAVTEVFVGESDDLMPTEYEPVVRELFLEPGDVLDDVADPARLAGFRELVSEMRPPTILSTFVMEGQDFTDITQGLRIMGQRYIPDSFMFQNLVHDKVLDRYFPMGLDAVAVLDDGRAEELLASEKTAYPDYGPQLAALQSEFANLTPASWRENLYMGWMDTLSSLHANFSQGKYPDFMRDPAWRTQKLGTHLGSWTELRHDTILYAKQSYTVEAGAVMGYKDPEERGYVEPIEGFYPRLIELTEDTKDRLNDLGVLSQERVGEFEGMLDILGRLDKMVRSELSGKDLTDSECEWLRGFGPELSSIARGTGSFDEDDQKTVLVADVHTDINTHKVLEEGVGYVDFLVVMVKGADGEWRYCTGPVFSYYEFKQPMADRLTDEAWRAMLEEGKAPDRPAWTEEYLL
jgi:hypothetical protein